MSVRSGSAASVALAVLLLGGGGAFALSNLDPGLASQLGIPVATGPEYTKLDQSATVGEVRVTLARAALTHQKAVIGYTYDRPVERTDGRSGRLLSLTSREGDSFRAFAVDKLAQGVKDGAIHGSTVMYFAVERLADTSQDRHLRLKLTPCDESHANYPDEAAVFDLILPLQH